MFNYRFVIVILAGVATSACATLPTLQTQRGVDVNLIVDATKCELASILRDPDHPEYAKAMNKWSAKVTLDLRVVYDNSGGPSATLIVPYHAGTIEVNGALGGTAQSNRAGHLAYNVAQLKELNHLPCERGAATGIPFSPYELGLRDWLRTAVGSVTRTDDYVDLSELTYTLEFIVEQTASGDVRIRSAPGPRNGTADLGGRASAKDTNTLLVTLVPPPPPSPPPPTRIKIVEWPKSFPGLPATPDGPKTFAPDASAPAGGQIGPAPVRRRSVVQRPRTPARSTLDPYTQQRLDDLQVKQRLFNSITLPRSTLNAF